MPQVAGITVKLDTRKLDALQKGLMPTADAIVRKTAKDVQFGAAARSRVRYGFMKDGWQTQRLGPLLMMVYNPVDYTIYNEFGTRSMSAQPMLTPSIEQHRPYFMRAWGALLR